MQKEGEIDEKLHFKLLPRKTQIPRMFGQPKIHKEGNPLREVVDSSGSVTNDINKFVSKIIKPYAEKNEFTIKNSTEFIRRAKDLKVEDDEVIVSYDVKALYPSVPQLEALDMINNLLTNDTNLKDRTKISPRNIMRLFRICVDNTYFQFMMKLYKQIDGLAIGASTSGFAADIFMNGLEKKAISTFIEAPEIWLRFVDDTFSKLKKALVEAFMNHLNSQHPRIQFTSEIMENNKIAFLDTEVIKKQDGGLKFKIYKKPTHTDQYLMYESNHHIGQKLGIINTLQTRIETLVTEDEDKKEAIEEMKGAMRGCNYPEWALNRKKKDRKKEDEQIYRGKVVVPYVKKLSEKFARTMKKYNIETIHKPTIKLKSLVCNMKDKVHPLDKTGAIYETDCKKHPEADYVGETDRATKSRGYEHGIISHRDSKRSHSIAEEIVQEEEIPSTSTRQSNRNTKKHNYKNLHTGKNIRLSEGNTVVSKHIATHEHEENDVTIKAIGYDQNWYTRGIREAIEIRKRKPKLNEDGGRFHLNPIYDIILNAEPCRNEGDDVIAESRDENWR